MTLPKPFFIDPSSKLLQHIDRLSDIRDGAKPAPVNVEIDLSNRCGLGCTWCHFGYTHTRGPLAKRPKMADQLDMGDLMDTGLAHSIIDQLTTAGVRSLTWTGGGEPTIHPHFDEIIGYAGTKINQGLYTNGTAINPSRAALLRDAMQWVYVSLDRHTRASYLETKQVDQFSAAIQGIRNLVAAPGDATIGVGFLLDATNWQQGNEMIELALSLGADYLQFRPTILYDMGHPNQKPADVGWVKPCVQWLESVLDRPEARQGKILADLDRFLMYRNWRGRDYPTCYWTQLQTVITPNGKVWRCVNRRGFPDDCIGNLAEESFSEIWERSGSFAVNDHCRLMCRGEIPNRTLSQIMREDVPHKDFI